MSLLLEAMLDRVSLLHIISKLSFTLDSQHSRVHLLSTVDILDLTRNAQINWVHLMSTINKLSLVLNAWCDWAHLLFIVYRQSLLLNFLDWVHLSPITNNQTSCSMPAIGCISHPRSNTHNESYAWHPSWLSISLAHNWQFEPHTQCSTQSNTSPHLQLADEASHLAPNTIEYVSDPQLTNWAWCSTLCAIGFISQTKPHTLLLIWLSTSLTTVGRQGLLHNIRDREHLSPIVNKPNLLLNTHSRVHLLLTIYIFHPRSNTSITRSQQTLSHTQHQVGSSISLAYHFL